MALPWLRLRGGNRTGGLPVGINLQQLQESSDSLLQRITVINNNHKHKLQYYYENYENFP